MRETRVEAKLTQVTKAMKGWAIKLLPSVSGLPDRLVLLPGGRVIFVELKSPTGTVAPHQTVVHNRLRALGFQVYVLSTPEMVVQWATDMEES